MRTNTAPRMSRRDVMRTFGAGATALALPVLRGSEAFGQGAAPKCLVVMFNSNGVVPSRFWPTGGETNFQLGPSLKALEPWKSKLLVLRGVHMNTRSAGPGDGHQMGVGQLLTGRELLSGPFKGNGLNPPAGFGSGISIDQEVANHLKVKSLDLAVRPGGRSVITRIAYAASNLPRDPREDPNKVYDAVFAGFVAPGGGGGAASAETTRLERLRARRQSVIDHVEGDLEALRTTLPAADRPKLDAHLQALRNIENGLQGLAGGSSAPRTAACVPSPRPEPGLSLAAAASYPTIGRLHTEMLVMALACGITRVASLQWSHGVSSTTHPWLGINDPHHVLSHAGNADTASQDKLAKIDAWHAEQFAHLIKRMSDVALLDSSVLLWTNDLGQGNSHTEKNIPFVIAGSGGGHFKTGRYVQVTGKPHNDLLVSVANAMGHGITTFGDPRFCTGPLAI